MPNTLTLPDTDLAALFGIEMDTGIEPAHVPADILCGKCHSRGNFIGYTGRVVGRCFACAGTGLSNAAQGLPEPGAEISVEAIATAFASARAKGIKTPKLRLDTFVFSRAPDHGSNAGSIYVKGDGEYLGKVTAGRFLPSRACDDPTRDRVVAAAADPHASARAYGQRTGTCSCCGRELTNAESIALSIGPICRDKFGW
jgi:Family of unknown function (DUF6011)